MAFPATTFVSKQTVISLAWAQAVNDRIAETVNVRDYGALGNGTTDDASAIQSAITANPGKTIYFPAGTYKIGTSLVVTSNNTRLLGAGQNCCYLLNATTNGDAVRFYCTATAATSDFVNGVGLSGFYIYRTTAATAGASIRLTQVNGGAFDNFTSSDCPEGVTVEGGQFNEFAKFKLFATGATFDLSATANSALIHFKEATLSGGLYQPCFTVTLSNVFATASKKTWTIFNIANVDGLEMSTGYIANGKQTLFSIAGARNGGYVAGVAIANVYFDAVNNSTGAQTCANVSTDAYGSFAIYDVSFTGCIFGNTVAEGFKGRKGVVSLKFTGCTFVNINTWAVDMEGASGTSNMNVIGCQFNGMSLLAGATGTIKAKDLLTFNYVGNEIRIDSGSAASVALSGTVDTYTITGNSHKSNTKDFSTSATTNKATIAGNSSGSDTSAANSFSGTSVGNISITDATRLDWYLEGSITPTLTFGGGSTGLTYSTQAGTYTRIGNRVLFEFKIALSAIGSSTGVAIIGGLPYANGAGRASAVSMRLSSGSATIGDTSLHAILPTGAQAVQVYKMVAGVATQLADTDFSSTTQLEIAGVYVV